MEWSMHSHCTGKAGRLGGEKSKPCSWKCKVVGEDRLGRNKIVEKKRTSQRKLRVGDE